MGKLKIAIALLCMACVLNVQAKGKNKKEAKPVYAFGLSVSFTDSVAYYTPIQLLDSVALGSNKMLLERDQYSYQLKEYLEFKKELKDRTCVIYFNENVNKLTKEHNKVLNKQKKKNLILKSIDASDFKFTKPDVE